MAGGESLKADLNGHLPAGNGEKLPPGQNSIDAALFGAIPLLGSSAPRPRTRTPAPDTSPPATLRS